MIHFESVLNQARDKKVKKRQKNIGDVFVFLSGETDINPLLGVLSKDTDI